MSQAQLERKVGDYLRKSQALEDYWQRPITAEQLQAEMGRMAIHTKKPEVLRELFAALGNDAFVIAECLARPALADRLLKNRYGYDDRIHNDLKQRVQSDLQMHPTLEQMKQLSGTYREVEYIKSDGSHQRPERRRAGVKLDSHQWDETAQKLAATFSGGAAKAPSFQIGRGLAGSKSGHMSAHAAPSPRLCNDPRWKTESAARRNTLLRNRGVRKTATVSRLLRFVGQRPLETWLAR
jgi:hypothetical protein